MVTTRSTSSGSTGAVSRRAILKYAGGLTGALAFAATLSACGTEKAPRDRRIEAGISYTLSGGFDPMTTSGATPMAVNVHIFEGLVDLHPATREPYLALAADMPEPVDDRTYEVTLRQGATFHNGDPVTVDDVVFSFRRVLDPENASILAQFVSFIDAVEAVGEDRVRFTLNQPFPLFAERISCVKIVPQAVVENPDSNFDASPVGSGPFRFVLALKDNRIEMAAHPEYNGQYPATVDQMIWYLLSDAAARVTAQDSDRVQAIEDVPYLDADWLNEHSDLEQVSSFGLLFLMFNLDREPFSDVRVRQALHYGLDTATVIERGLLGSASAATSYVQEDHPDYIRAATVYDYDPERAAQLLQEAGITDLSFTLVATNTSWVADLLPLVLESWNKLPGVSVDLQSLQSGAMYSQLIDTGEYEVCMAPGDPSVFGNDLDLLLSWWYRGTTWPDTRYHWVGSPEHTELLELMDAATATTGPEAARQSWSQAIDILSDQVPLYPVLHRKLPTAWNGAELQNFQPLPTTGLSFLGVGRS